MRILVLNAGSSSLKTSLIEEPGDRTLSRVELQRVPGPDAWTDALRSAAADAGEVDAVGHRIVHGGSRYTAPLRLDADVVDELDALRALAPLHNGPALEVVETARRALPRMPQVGCFDTAFHAGLPASAYVYPLPYEWHEAWGVRRFGFHGLSVAWSVERAASLLSRSVEELAVVVAHLGSGCSVTAVLGGRSVDTSMGMTPLEGLMMGTRSGSVDPGILLDLLADARLGGAELSDALQHRSGLLGVSGLSADMREVQRAAADGSAQAQLAVEIFVRRAAAGIAAAATSLPRLDAIAFTGGIGEHADEVRELICRRLAPLGVAAGLRPTDGDAVLSAEGAAVVVLQVEAREDLVIAREVHSVLTS
jgi:acetate kinase